MSSFMYVILKIHFNIVYIIFLINRYLINFISAYWNAIIQIFRYFKNIIHYELVYKNFLKNLFDYIDFDWIENSIRKFIFDYLFNLSNDIIN